MNFIWSPQKWTLLLLVALTNEAEDVFERVPLLVLVFSFLAQVILGLSCFTCQRGISLEHFVINEVFGLNHTLLNALNHLFTGKLKLEVLGKHLVSMALSIQMEENRLFYILLVQNPQLSARISSLAKRHTFYRFEVFFVAR